MVHQSDMTGVVVDIGDGAPQVVPVVNGYVIGSSMKSFPISGNDVTHFILQLLQVYFYFCFSWAVHYKVLSGSVYKNCW